MPEAAEHPVFPLRLSGFLYSNFFEKMLNLPSRMRFSCPLFAPMVRSFRD
jgi:hypothetical protein